MRRTEVTARAIVNVAGPWVKRVPRHDQRHAPSKENVRHVKGSHIVVPRVHTGAPRLHPAERRQAHRLRDPVPGPLLADRHDRRAGDEFEQPEISRDEIDYLLELANTYLAQPLARGDVVWTFTGIRPLYDDGPSDPSAITRDYVLKLDTGDGGGAAALSIYGGKITTYRKLAEHALAELKPFLPPMKPRVDAATAALPGGDLPAGGLDAWVARARAALSPAAGRSVRGLARRHGSLALATCSATRDRRGPRRGLRQRAHRGAKSTTSCARNGRAAPTTCCGAGPSAVSACRGARARATRGRRALRAPQAADRRGVSGRAPPTPDAAARRDAATRRVAAIRGVLTDIDDTLTTRGRLTADAYAAMERLRAAGQARDPDHRPPGGMVRPHRADVAGRRASSARTARCTCATTPRARRLVRRFVVDERDAAREPRAARGGRRRGSSRAVPGCALASDQLYREADLAIDFREDVPALPREAVDRIVAMMEAEGMTAKVSSIHVNGWFGALRQAAMTRALLAEASASTSTRSASASSSSATRRTTRRCSRFFPNAVGVANVREFADRIATLPAYVTRAEAGAGFAELADFCSLA